MALLAMIVVIAAGCGDAESTAEGDQGGEPVAKVILRTSHLSKAEYVDRVNRLCDESWARMLKGFASRYSRVAHAYRDGRDSEGEGKRFQSASRRIFLAGLQAQFDDIQYIGASAGHEKQVTTLLRALQERVYDGWEQRIPSAKQFMEVFNHFNWLAYRFGVIHCLVYESNFRETVRDREEA